MARPKKAPKLTIVGGAPEIGGIRPEDQQQALFFQNKNKIVALKGKMASINSDLRNAYKTAKSDGFTKKEIDFAIALEGDEDDKLTTERQRQNMIARWLGHPIGTQAEMDLAPNRQSIEERAAIEGKKAGMDGQSLKPPYAPGAPGYDSYVESWHKGQAAIFAIRQKPADAPDLLREEGTAPIAKTDEFDGAADGGGFEESGDDADDESEPADAL